MYFFPAKHSGLYTANVPRPTIHPAKAIQNESNQKNSIPQRSKQLQQLLD
jgi:hypothetical protein